MVLRKFGVESQVTKMIEANLKKRKAHEKIVPFFVAKTVNISELTGESVGSQHKLLREKSKASHIQSSKMHRPAIANNGQEKTRPSSMNNAEKDIYRQGRLSSSRNPREDIIKQRTQAL